MRCFATLQLILGLILKELLLDSINLITEQKINRFFRARKKFTQGNIISHITQRAAGKDLCFVEDDDFLCMLGFLKDSAKKHDYEIYAFCLMGNHIHLLLQPHRENLQVAMRDLFSRYAMRFNRKYERRGHLFGGPYRQAICLDESYLIAASTYIHLNPVKADIVNDSRDYRWSSVRLFVDDSEKMSFVNASFILQILSTDLHIAKNRYQKILRKGAKLSDGSVQTEKEGLELFRKKLLSAFPKVFGNKTTSKTVAHIAGKDILNIESLEQRIDNAVAQEGKRKPETRFAMKFLIEQLIARGFRRSEIADRLQISTKTVYNILRT